MQKDLYKLRYQVDETEWKAKAKRYLIRKYFAKYFDRTKVKVLDFGCGTGLLQLELEKEFKEASCYGLDISAQAINYAKKRGLTRVNIYQGKKLPFKDGFFDLVIAVDVLEHIKDDLSALLEIKRVLKRGGLAFILVPAHTYFWSSRDLILHHFRRYNDGELEQKSQNVNFTLVESINIDFVLYFVFWFFLQIAPEKSKVKQFGWETAQLNPVLSFFLYNYQIFEYQFLKFWSYPFGLSKIVIIQK